MKQSNSSGRKITVTFSAEDLAAFEAADRAAGGFMSESAGPNWRAWLVKRAAMAVVRALREESGDLVLPLAVQIQKPRAGGAGWVPRVLPDPKRN